MRSLSQKLYDREYAKKNKAKRKQQRHEYYLKNKEKVRAQAKLWRENNIEKAKESARVRRRRYYQEKKEKEMKRYFSKLAYERRNPGRWRNYYYGKILSDRLVPQPRD